MIEIQRYDYDKVWGMEEHELGDYVQYDDHAAIVAQLETDKSNAEYCFRELKKINERLEADLAEARKDQARYQWLRNKANSSKNPAPLVFFTDDACKPTWENVLHSADLDQAIDIATSEI